MKRRLGSGRISPPAGFEPVTRDPKSGALTAQPRGRFLRFYGQVNSYGYVEPISYTLTLFLDRLRPTKRLT